MKIFAKLAPSAALPAAAMLCACAGSAERKIAAEAELLAPLEAGVVLPKEPAGLSSEIKKRHAHGGGGF